MSSIARHLLQKQPHHTLPDPSRATEPSSLAVPARKTMGAGCSLALDDELIIFFTSLWCVSSQKRKTSGALSQFACKMHEFGIFALRKDNSLIKADFTSMKNEQSC